METLTQLECLFIELLRELDEQQRDDILRLLEALKEANA